MENEFINEIKNVFQKYVIEIKGNDIFDGNDDFQETRLNLFLKNDTVIGIDELLGEVLGMKMQISI